MPARVIAHLAVATAGGALWALCFGKQSLPVAAGLALVPLLALLGRPHAALLGWLHGVVFWLVAIPWIRPTLETYGGLPTWLASLSLLLLALYLGLFHGLFSGLGAALWRRGGGVALAGLPALWVALEWLRAHLLSGFPWNLAAYAWTDLPGALPTAAWIGAYGVSFLLVLVNTAVARAVLRGRWLAGVTAVLGCLLLLATGARWGVGEPATDLPERPLRLLQPNSENLAEWDPVRIAQNYRRIFTLSRAACDVDGALLVWPESAAWPYAWGADPELRRDLRRLAATGCPVLFNSTEQRPEGYYNSVLVLDRGGIQGSYDKRHLVPFGEYVPLARVFFFLDEIARNAGAYQAGREPALLPWGDERLGPAVCFEVIFPAEVAELTRGGATLLVTVTNDAWYGDTSAPHQHFRAVRFRAAENRRVFLRAAITGISAVVAPDGSVLQRLGVGEEGVMRAAVAGRRDLSPYARWPSLVPATAVVVALVGLFLARRGAG